MPDQVIGNYKIIGMIGEGGMGEVFKGIDLMLEREVAIKSLRPEYARRSDIVERFRKEARAAASLNHPNIVTVYSFFRQGDSFFLVMEFVYGKTLDNIITHEGAMPWRRAVPLFCQALHGIEHAHLHGIIHRDIKPGNMIVNKTGILKVMDFGIARVLGTARLTRAGHLIGTLEYMSPEQIQGREVDARSDIYSLGVVLYEMLTGRVPFSGTSEYELLRAQVEEPPQPLRRFAPAVPAAIENVVMQALAKTPAQRLQTVSEFREFLENLLHGAREEAKKIRVPESTSALPESPPSPPLQPELKTSPPSADQAAAIQPVSPKSSLDEELVSVLTSTEKQKEIIPEPPPSVIKPLVPPAIEPVREQDKRSDERALPVAEIQPPETRLAPVAESWTERVSPVAEVQPPETRLAPVSEPWTERVSPVAEVQPPETRLAPVSEPGAERVSPAAEVQPPETRLAPVSEPWTERVSPVAEAQPPETRLAPVSESWTERVSPVAEVQPPETRLAPPVESIAEPRTSRPSLTQQPQKVEPVKPRAVPPTVIVTDLKESVNQEGSAVPLPLKVPSPFRKLTWGVIGLLVAIISALAAVYQFQGFKQQPARHTEETAKRQVEEAARRRAAEEEAQRQATEEAARRQAEEAQRQATEEAARRRAVEEAQRQATEEAARRQAVEEAQRQATEEAARRRAEAAEEAKRQATEEKRKAAAEAKRQATAEEKRKAAEEAKRQAAEEKRRAAEAAKRQSAEEAKRQAAAEAAKRQSAEEAKRQAAAEAAKRQSAEEAKRQAAAEAAKRQAAEEAKRQAAAEAAKRQAAEEAKSRPSEAPRRPPTVGTF